MRLESKAATADRNWWILRAVLFLGFALYFVYDGALGWPGAVRKEAEKQLAGGVFEAQVKYDDLKRHPEKTDFAKFRRQLDELRLAGEPLRATLLAPDEGAPPLGAPALVKLVGGREVRYYAGRYGFASIEVEGDRIIFDTMKWNDWKKDYDHDKIIGQFYWSLLPGVFGLYFLYRAVRAARLRVVIDDQGLLYDGRRIAFADMTALRDYSPKGWVDLHYQSNGRSERLRIDNEKVQRFEEIVEELVREKRFEHPIEVYRRKQAEEAEEAAENDSEEALKAERAGDDQAADSEPDTRDDQSPDRRP